MSRKELFQRGTFTLGVNYWASHAATRMWTQWDESVVEKDLENLGKIGCQVLRVFPLWPDFQPVMVLRTASAKCGFRYDYAFTGEKPLPKTEAGRAGVDEVMMERFEKLCDIAQKYGVKVIVPLINGHMTFRLYNPPAVDGLDHFTDPESLMWQGKFIRYFVKRMKHHPAIMAWEVGNESNCMSVASGRSTAWTWMAFVTDAIRSQDHTRPVCSGMYGFSLQISQDRPWLLADQEELCDVLTAHTYPIWSDFVNRDRPNTLRWSNFASSQAKIYADIAGKECFVEEIGTMRRTYSDFEALGRQARNLLWELWRDDARALLWWCAYDQIGMEFPPYDWNDAGMEHGVLTSDYQVNPTGRAMQTFSEFLKKCPVKQLPPPREQAVCILGRDQEIQELGLGVTVLAKQASLPIRFAYAADGIPDAQVYLIPCAVKKGSLNREAYRILTDKVKAGATVYMSVESSFSAPAPEEFFGIEVQSRRQNCETVNLKMDGLFDIPLCPSHRFVMRSHGAVALDEAGCIWEHKLGKGRVITVALPLEMLMTKKRDSFQSYPVYRLYRMIGESIVKENVLQVTDGEVVVSEHPASSTTIYAVITNNSPDDKRVELTITRETWAVSHAYSDCEDVRLEEKTLVLPGNCGALLVLEKNS